MKKTFPVDFPTSRLHYLSKYNHKIDLAKNQLHNPQSRKTAILIPHAESVVSEKAREGESEWKIVFETLSRQRRAKIHCHNLSTLNYPPMEIKWIFARLKRPNSFFFNS